MENAGRLDLGDYLRRQRARMAPPPAASGLGDSRRRVPGLRRQELAEIAAISVEYYTRLEQGRAPRPSRAVLTALARALELSVPEQDHLFRLAGELPPEPSEPSATVRPGLLRLLEHLDPTVPVTVHDGRLDVVAANSAAAELFGPLVGDGLYGRNVVHRAFTSTHLVERLDGSGADQLRRAATAELRAALSRYPDDTYLLGLLDELTARSPSFRERWARGEVGEWRSVHKRIRRSSGEWLDFDIEMLHDPARDHWFMLYVHSRRFTACAPT